MTRTISIYLEGFDWQIARQMMSDGELPNLSTLGKNSLQYELNQDPVALRSGMSGEQIATGKSPEQLNSYYTNQFDPNTYDFYLTRTTFAPLSSIIKEPNVSFDLAYYELDKSPNTLGITGWGSHDIGCMPSANPSTLKAELLDKFGPYKGADYLYGYVWPSVEKTADMGEKLAAAVAQRAEVVEWLLAERFTDWKFAQIAVSEPHSGIEGLFHGMDSDHPVGHHPSAPVAKQAMLEIYRACDNLVGKLKERFSDANLVVYSMHGMGSNDSDVPAMAILPELLYRNEFSKPFLDPSSCSEIDTKTGIPVPVYQNQWERSIREGVKTNTVKQFFLRLRRRQERIRRDVHNSSEDKLSTEGFAEGLDWMPGTLYKPFWAKMKAFCLPNFTDGHIRLNVKGREKSGRIRPSDYASEIERMRKFVMQITDPATGESVVEDVDYNDSGDPFQVGARQADLIVIWKKGVHTTAFDHPSTGVVGPFPTRRTGGHTGENGFALVDLSEEGPKAKLTSSYSLQPKLGTALDGKTKIPVRDSFDIVPTLFELIGYEQNDTAGESLLKDQHSIVEPKTSHA